MTIQTSPVVKHSAFIGAPISQVWETLVSSSGWDRWFTSGTVLEPKVGGKLLFVWKNHGPDRWSGEDEGKVVEMDAPTTFAFDWHMRGGHPWPIRVRFLLSSQGKGTRVDLEESGYELSEVGMRTLVGNATGWGEAITLLKFYLEHGITYGEVP